MDRFYFLRWQRTLDSKLFCLHVDWHQCHSLQRWSPLFCLQRTLRENRSEISFKRQYALSFKYRCTFCHPSISMILTYCEHYNKLINGELSIRFGYFHRMPILTHPAIGSIQRGIKKLSYNALLPPERPPLTALSPSHCTNASGRSECSTTEALY